MVARSWPVSVLARISPLCQPRPEEGWSCLPQPLIKDSPSPSRADKVRPCCPGLIECAPFSCPKNSWKKVVPGTKKGLRRRRCAGPSLKPLGWRWRPVVLFVLTLSSSPACFSLHLSIDFISRCGICPRVHFSQWL